jgi:hypothetical protein
VVLSDKQRKSSDFTPIPVNISAHTSAANDGCQKTLKPANKGQDLV